MAVHQVQFDMDAGGWVARSRANELNGQSASAVTLRTDKMRIWSYFAYQFMPLDVGKALLGEPPISYRSEPGANPRFLRERTEVGSIHWIIQRWRDLAKDEKQPAKIRIDCMDRLRDMHRFGMSCHPGFIKSQRGESEGADEGGGGADIALMDVIAGKRGKIGVA